jgi:hypothetical protein
MSIIGWIEGIASETLAMSVEPLGGWLEVSAKRLPIADAFRA